VQRVGVKERGKKKGRREKKEKRKRTKRKEKKRKEKRERERERELLAGFAATVGQARTAPFGRSATSMRNERKGKGKGRRLDSGVGTADHRKKISGKQELGQEKNLE
jgi:hypothetical protein